MSFRYARKHGFILAEKDHRAFELANGKAARALGKVEAKWRFSAEPERGYDLVFYVLRKCSRHVILGNKFLQETRTMSVHKQRIRYAKRKMLTQRVVNLIGNHNKTQRMAGYLNGVPVLALPDSGAQPNIVSAAFAEANGWEISENHSSLKFADGSVQESLGQVCGTWRFGENDGRETRQLIFEVLRDCPFNVVLGQEIVYGLGIYQNYADSMITIICLSKYGNGFNLVVYIPRFLKKLREKLSKGCSADTSATQDNKEKELEDELLLRKIENQELERLSELRKSIREREIATRRQRWEAAHRARGV
ncbi:uncharacterized protein BDR25DRAFT_312927 [Lindgomyces ingoldianus]|uniref:Uncharacterized protein n=1 Tax=Lindgomyces ingoldianus TaxID=673940 RepID=A0ACB6R1I9_9PLEO|nr:uncharacterized protein BDR25DRAFT_312927 [Lindgomyces ingoldianus]KAF2472377.1 hypothetical protein BDR25DRAFT_312927 [Lindgomyces ingoldianus]